MESRASLADRDAILSPVNTTAFLLLTAFLALSPFPYGAVTPAATFALTGSAFVIGALTFLTRPGARRIGAVIIPLTALALIGIIGTVQLAPMTASTLKAIAPVSAKTYADANEILALFNRPSLRPKISIAPADTQTTILLTFAYVVLFACAAILFSTRRRRRVALTVFFTSVVIHLLYSTATTPAAERLHGTFINPNHFAGYLEIALAFAFGVAWRELLHNRERADGIRDLADRVEKRAVPLVGPVLLWAVVAAGIALTRSRGGILAALLTTVTLVALAPLHRRQSRASIAIPVVLVVAGGLIFVAFTTGEAPLLRFFASDPRDIRSDMRTEIWRASLRAYDHSPLLGTGLGTFREAFRRVQPRSVEGLVEQAHNDFLQMLVTGGWIGGALVAIAFASMLIILIRAWLQQEHREESAIGLAGIGALLSLMVHGLVEFNMSIPAIPATLAVMLGLAWAAAIFQPRPSRASTP
jgi:putative inorganic carbon (hco3(-)) transporter